MYQKSESKRLSHLFLLAARDVSQSRLWLSPVREVLLDHSLIHVLILVSIFTFQPPNYLRDCTGEVLRVWLELRVFFWEATLIVPRNINEVPVALPSPAYELDVISHGGTLDKGIGALLIVVVPMWVQLQKGEKLVCSLQSWRWVFQKFLISDPCNYSSDEFLGYLLLKTWTSVLKLDTKGKAKVLKKVSLWNIWNEMELYSLIR